FASELKDFKDLIEAVARVKNNLPPAIIEKDYYVIRALHALQDAISGQFIFKGGTSLSKGWNLLERFSEDVDLLFRTRQNSSAISKAELNRRMKSAQHIVERTMGFTLESEFSDKGTHRKSRFTYRQNFPTASVLSNAVLLEMGTRGGDNPSTRRSVQSFIAEYAAAHNQQDLAEDLTEFEVECLDIRRTFVEKLFAVHAAYERNQAAGKVRHYYDLYQLAGLEEIQKFSGTDEYREVYADVERHSRDCFPDTALPSNGSFTASRAFSPDEAGRAILHRHYAKDRDLFFVAPPSLESILLRLQELLPKL
ncbi:MAG: nucleotidyl transferase AbiEii/AbiGii toxin family protein, partial [Pyrinomonadaceae bacterium]